MKNIIATIFVIATLIVIGYLGYKNDQLTTQIENTPKVDLPEEYKDIDLSDNLYGYFDDEGILHIEFDNKDKFKEVE